MARRLEVIEKHLNTKQEEDDVVIVCGWRTRWARAGKGSFANVSVEDLVVPVLKKVLDTSGCPPDMVEDVLFGKVAGESGEGHMALRRACFLAGMPSGTSCATINRACASGLESIAVMHARIMSGQVSVGIAGGVEHMSKDRLQSVTSSTSAQDKEAEAAKKKKASSLPKASESLRGGHSLADLVEGTKWGMGWTSERVALSRGVSRREQDEAALLSHERAAKYAAERHGLEVVDGTRDEGYRDACKMEDLERLKGAFFEDGMSTAGNSSPLTDGACCVLMMKRSAMRQYCNKDIAPLGSLKAWTTVGLDPRIMGEGPAVAIPKLLAKCNLNIQDIDVWEINEAFASQFLYSLKHLGLPIEKVNQWGGAIALGHPLAASASRMVLTALHQLKKKKAKYAVVSMCVGGGFGCAALLQSE